MVATEVRSHGVRAVPSVVDLADPEALRTAVERTIAELGGVRVLVNSAATDAPSDIEHLAVGDWDLVLAVNLRAPFLLSKIAFPHMREAGGGTIVNVSSIAGRRGWANASAYCASKFALTGLTQVLNAEGRAYGIRACVIYPGGMATSWGSWEAARRQSSQRAPESAARALPPERIASLIVWLASAPPELVLNEITATPLEETGWP